MTNATAIATAGLTKHYPGVAALTDLTLDVPSGSIYGFLGPNGAGKSTTLKLLAGLSHPTSGSATVNGIAIEAGPAYRARSRLSRAGPALLRLDDGSRHAPLRHVAVPGRRPRRRCGDDRHARPGRPGRRGGPADRGVFGRHAPAAGSPRPSIGSPSVLLLDEPVSALDPLGRREVLDLMRELRGEVTVFYSTHILDDVQRVSDHVAILDGGRLVTAAPTAELLDSFARDQLRVASAAPMTPRPWPWRPSPASPRSSPSIATATCARTSSGSSPVPRPRCRLGSRASVRTTTWRSSRTTTNASAWRTSSSASSTARSVRHDRLDHHRHPASTAATGDRALAGVRPLIRKELSDWRHGKRVWVILGVSALFMALAAANSWINAWVIANLPAGAEAPGCPISMVPLDNVLAAAGYPSSFSRDLRHDEPARRRAGRGTLAWMASKPIARPAIWTAKWVAGAWWSRWPRCSCPSPSRSQS